ncbi:Flp pilus assembly complex ATPase component TadA [Escherichia coli]|nr:Flp pilus assembly complex ATPase component TadA [Escherichia coli]
MRIHSPYPASWALAQRIGYLYSEGEIIYLADTPFERLLDIQRQVGQCQTMTSLSQADFEARLEAVFHQNTGESQQIAQDIDQSVDLLSLSEEMPANEDLLNEDSAAPVIRLINAILSEAIKETASDIHIETYEKTMSIRFRIDGVLRTILQPNKKLAALLISRIKVMARLDIAEKRIPQDGRISLRIGRRNIDVRVR